LLKGEQIFLSSKFIASYLQMITECYFIPLFAEHQKRTSGKASIICIE